MVLVNFVWRFRAFCFLEDAVSWEIPNMLKMETSCEVGALHPPGFQLDLSNIRNDLRAINANSVLYLPRYLS